MNVERGTAMEVLDNINRTVKEDLQAVINKDSKVSIQACVLAKQAGGIDAQHRCGRHCDRGRSL